MLEWLSSYDPYQTHYRMSSNRCEGTGEWFLDGEDFRRWNSNGDETLVAHGAPGCGKSMLTSLIIDHLSRKAGDSYGLAYLYFDHAQPECQVLEQVASCLIKQLCLNLGRLPDAVKQLRQTHSTKGTRPSLEELITLLNRRTTPFDQIYLILDAIDECEQVQRKRLLTLLKQLNKRRRVGIYLSCRSHLMHSFKDDFAITDVQIEARPKDLELSISNALEDSDVETPVAFKQQLKTRLISAANGM